MAKKKEEDEAVSLFCLKKLSSLAKKMPRQDRKGRGVDAATMKRHIMSGRLHIGEPLHIDGVKHWIIPEADLAKPDWGLQEKYHARRRGRPTNLERLGI